MLLQEVLQIKAGIRAGSLLTATNQREVPLGGDIILQIDNNKVRKIDYLLTYLEREKEVGDTVQLTILRNGVTEKIPVTLGARPRLTTVCRCSIDTRKPSSADSQNTRKISI